MNSGKIHWATYGNNEGILFDRDSSIRIVHKILRGHFSHVVEINNSFGSLVEAKAWAEKIKVKIIEIKEGKISLSIKALKENPWKEAEKKYKKDDVVSGVVIKFNKHGALASIEEGIAGLVHISEFGSDEKLHSTLELGKSYKFKIGVFDPKEQKMTLSFIDPSKKAE